MFFLAIFLACAVTFLLSAYFLPGVAIVRVEGVIVFSVLIGLANSLVRPIKRLTLQAKIWNFGILELLVNLLVIYFGGKAIYGVEIYTWYAYVFLVVVLTLMHLLINFVAKHIRGSRYAALPKSKKERRREVFILLESLVGIIFVVAVGILFVPKAAVSGKVIYNGVLPENSEEYTISIVQKQYRSGDEYKVADENLPAATVNDWHWSDAQEGVTYQLQAIAVKGDHVAATSSVIEVTAPASEQLLVFNVTSQELEAAAADPDSATAESTSETTGTTETTNPEEGGGTEAQSATVSGTLDLNGYIPGESTISMYKRASDQADFVMTREVPATDGTYLEWDSAVAGQAYSYYGVLYTKEGTEIGRSHAETIIAPSLNNTLTINSTAVQPVPPEKVSISGTVRLNGVIPLNSSISMRQKKAGESAYHEFASLEATDGVAWEYDDADESQQYNIKAVLRVNNSDYKEGQVLTVTAPASGEVITIDTGIPPAGPECAVNYNIRNDWGTGMTTDILIRNLTSSSITSWQLRWTFPGNQTIEQMWNATSSQSGKNVTASSNLAIPPNQGEIQMGFNASYHGQNKKPTSFTLNGDQCDLF